MAPPAAAPAAAAAAAAEAAVGAFIVGGGGAVPIRRDHDPPRVGPRVDGWEVEKVESGESAENVVPTLVPVMSGSCSGSGSGDTSVGVGLLFYQRTDTESRVVGGNGHGKVKGVWGHATFSVF